MLRQPGAGHAEDRLDRHAAARRRSPHRRRRKGDRELAVRRVGELLHAGAAVMSEYWNNPLETAETLQSPWRRRAVGAHRRPRLHGRGRLRFPCRPQEGPGKTSGFQVWPREIEEVLAAHPAVQEVCVAGVPHPVKGEVKGVGGADTVSAATEDELRAYCRERLAPYKVPARSGVPRGPAQVDGRQSAATGAGGRRRTSRPVTGRGQRRRARQRMPARPARQPRGIAVDADRVNPERVTRLPSTAATARSRDHPDRPRTAAAAS